MRDTLYQLMSGYGEYIALIESSAPEEIVQKLWQMALKIESGSEVDDVIKMIKDTGHWADRIYVTEIKGNI